MDIQTFIAGFIAFAILGCMAWGAGELIGRYIERNFIVVVRERKP